MIERIGSIKNPLTIIAIFAGITEFSGTVVLPFIAADNQSFYVWFLIVFPTFLVLLFFLTLNFNHKVLYAPSDYQDEQNFLYSLPRATYAEKALKVEAEIAENSSSLEQFPQSKTSLAKPRETVGFNDNSPQNSFHGIARRSTQATYILAEEIIFRRLANEFGNKIQREIKILNSGTKYIFDGIVRDKGVTTVIEVKFLRRAMLSSTQSIPIRHSLHQIQQISKSLPLERAGSFRVLLALAVDDGNVNQELVASQIDSFRNEFSFPIEVRFYKLTELEPEFKTAA